MNTILARTLDGKLTDKINVDELLTESSKASDKATNSKMPLELVEDDKWQAAVNKRDAVKRVFEGGEAYAGSREKPRLGNPGLLVSHRR